MKGRESGMPEESWWASFFDVENALDALLGKSAHAGDMVEFGCGYGTFTLPAALRTTGIITALDLEPDMTAIVRQKANELHLKNIRIVQRDFVADGTGLDTGSQFHAMIYNLLHLENPAGLLLEAYRVLKPGGSLSVMNWRSDIPTPRGPSLNIRPQPEQCEKWIVETGFTRVERVNLEVSCPYHFGLVAAC
jgi:ubiquinone/menaquinone biosynthesis C-methylase UbiE